MEHNILKQRVEEACRRIADEGINDVEDKEVFLACFGMFMFNGMEHLSADLKDLKQMFIKAWWVTSMMIFSSLIAIILTLAFF